MLGRVFIMPLNLQKLSPYLSQLCEHLICAKIDKQQTCDSKSTSVASRNVVLTFSWS